MHTYTLHIYEDSLLKVHLSHYFKNLGWKRVKEGGDLIICKDINVDRVTDLLLYIKHTYCHSKLCYLSSGKIYDVPEENIQKCNESFVIMGGENTISSKYPNLLACDLLVQNFCKRANIWSVVARLGCIVGYKHHSAKGFLPELCRKAKADNTFFINGYDGCQVRDVLHWKELGKFIEEFYSTAAYGDVFDVGGGYWNSISVNQSIRLVEDLVGHKVKTEYIGVDDGRPIYISNIVSTMAKYNWYPKIQIKDICQELL